ncbi:MAG: 6-pyruvoyl tetrahydropterin synthase family protein [Chloroflexi bacterium]|nr:MAG: 6-pyruvoyl tetrahydropterin synthase family protein [Chloroflexota bacterium]TMG04181.1 MAG: 6-pyruvoyl tetrahydropterin synthase family protein [Chloroflexota bacterium]
MVFGRSVNRTSAPAPPMTYRITLERNTLRFAAAHFTTFGGECEPIHGHNYDVFVEVEGELSADSWVLDFSETKRRVAAICEELDHRFLLPTKSRSLGIEERDGEYEIAFGDRRYVLPESDVAALPIDNSTAERLAEWLNVRIRAVLSASGASNVGRVTVGVEEAPGQAGWFASDGPEG